MMVTRLLLMRMISLLSTPLVAPGSLCLSVMFSCSESSSGQLGLPPILRPSAGRERATRSLRSPETLQPSERERDAGSGSGSDTLRVSGHWVQLTRARAHCHWPVCSPLKLSRPDYTKIQRTNLFLMVHIRVGAVDMKGRYPNIFWYLFVLLPRLNCPFLEGIFWTWMIFQYPPGTKWSSRTRSS